MAKAKKTTTFGENLRSLRLQAGLTLKEVAQHIGIDISLLAKIERNERQASRKVIVEVSTFFGLDQAALQKDYLSDVIAQQILDEQGDLSILKVAEQKVKYFKTQQNGK